jgi:putative transposase
MIWARMLAYITGTVDQELLLRNEYLAAENRILRAQIKGRLLLSDVEKGTLAEIAHRLGRKALEELTAVAKPDTLLAWYRKLIAKKFDGSTFRKSLGRPRVDEETEWLVVRMAKENPGWGYDRIVGAMANLGFRLSDQTVGNILRHDIPPAPKRKHETSWKDFIRAHMAVLAATDFFTVEVLTLKGLMTYYVLFFIHLDSRRICLAGITRHPDQEWMEQMARNVTMEDSGFLVARRYLLHDRDSKYCYWSWQSRLSKPRRRCAVATLSSTRFIPARPILRFSMWRMGCAWSAIWPSMVFNGGAPTSRPARAKPVRKSCESG